MARLLDRKLLLPAEAKPFLLQDARSFAPRELHRAVARMRVDDHDFVDEGEAIQAGLENRGGVARDEDRRERRARRGAQMGISLRISGPYSIQ